MTETDSKTLAEALAKEQIELPSAQVTQLEAYCQLLWEWNSKLNLTRHTDFDRFVSRDLVDSLALARLLSPQERILDVGSGGGVPGVVLTIVRPDLEVDLSESVGKKAAALSAIVESLGLPAKVHQARAEAILADAAYDTVVARAVGSLWKLLKWFEPHWDSIGRLLLIKGPSWPEERGEARHRGYLRSLQLRRVASYPLAGTASESVILQLWPKGPDPAQRRGSKQG